MLELLGELTMALDALKKFKLDMSAEEIEDYENLTCDKSEEFTKLRNEIQQTDCSLMFIGDAGAGKSTLINLFVQKDILPTGVMKTTGAIIELHHNEVASFSTLTLDMSSSFVLQPVNFDQFPDKPSDALKRLVPSDSRDWPFLRSRINYPLPLLATGIVIHDSTGLNDNDELTAAVTQDMKTCQAFICVLNRGLTDASRRILRELIELGREPTSVFFVITHMENYSIEEKLISIDRLRTELEEINEHFRSCEIVLIDPHGVFDIFVKYNLYTKEYFESMLRINLFLHRILSFKSDLAGESLEHTFRKLCGFIHKIHYRAASIIKNHKKQQTTSTKRRSYFQNNQRRLRMKCHDLMVHLLGNGSDKIVEELKSNEFDSRFEQFTERIPFEANIEEHVNLSQPLSRELIINELDLYRLHVQKEFESYIKREFHPLLSTIASDSIHELGTMFCKDFCLSINEQNSFLENFKIEHLQNMLQSYQKILSTMWTSLQPQLVRFSEVFLSHYRIGTPTMITSIFDVILGRDDRALSDRSCWEAFCLKLAQKYRKKLIKLKKTKYQDAAHHQQCIDDAMMIVEQVFVGTQQQISGNINRCKKAKELLTRCNEYQVEKIPKLRCTLNKVVASRTDRWSLTENMIHSIELVDGLPNDRVTFIFKAKLEYKRTHKPVTVYVRRLSGTFCALHVCNQTRSIDDLNHPNVLHYYGAYRKGKNVYVVTEPWKESLRVVLNHAANLQLEHRLQMAVELTEICLDMFGIISIEQLTLDNLFITNKRHIKVNLLTYQPPFLVQSDDNRDELRSEISIIPVLGGILNQLFTTDEDNGVVYRHLRSLCIQCCEKIKNNHYQPPSLKQILHTLKLTQLNLQYPGLEAHNFMKTKRKPYGLLAIDGGGSRGIIAARILQQLENVIGRPIWEIFDFGAGVSTGGLLVLSALIKRTPSSQLVSIYRDLCEKIFPSRLTRFHEYSVKTLERELKQHFGEIRMSLVDSNSPHVFVVTKKNYEPEPYLLRNYDPPDNLNTFNGKSGWLCSEAARATTAAPTFFRPLERDGNQYTDGAMGFDNPVLLLFQEVLLLLTESNTENDRGKQSFPKIDYIVSIGTGKMDDWPAPVGSAKTGVSRFIETAQLGIELITNFENSHYQMQMLAKAC
ncbi:unnamed protein product, partial [Rotaria magnacalcarata]